MNKFTENLTKSYKSMNKHREHVDNQRVYNYKKKQYEKNKHCKRRQVNNNNLLENYDIQILNNNDNKDTKIFNHNEADFIKKTKEFIKKTKNFENLMRINGKYCLNDCDIIKICEAVKGRPICICCEECLIYKTYDVLSIDISLWRGCSGCPCCDNFFS